MINWLIMPSIAELEKLLSADPGDAFVLYGLAQAHARSGGHGRALEYYDRCLAADPAYCYAYYHKAHSLEALGRIADAVVTLEAGIRAARAAGDPHAMSEIEAYLETLEP
jgi:tetratricopeptide (TPR) repeat protein